MAHWNRNNEDLIQAAIEYYRIWMEENNILGNNDSED